MNDGLILLQQDTLVEVNDSDKENAAQCKYRDNNRYAKFPYRYKSMKKLEECSDNFIIMKGLSGEGLPLMDHPFTYKLNIGNVAGMICHSLWASISEMSWLHTDKTAFLYAWLTRNKEASNYFTVVSSAFAT